ncbi:hypothetical protein ABTZ59_33460 [Streptomyces sp. NPDC094034]|uniref:hypothetical protein n=1 Tax=Streptomyces sp. NPDC094034 TaxID=3155309 RepID=UPI00332C0814
MSLTSSLKDLDSPMSRFLAGHLPGVAALIGSYRAQLPLRPDTLRPEGSGPFDYRGLGRAIDLRLRVAFGTPVGSPLTAGIDLAALDIARAITLRAGLAARAAGDELLSELEAQQPAASGGAMRLADEAEVRLARLCFVASHFEEVYREGLRPGNPLLQADPARGLDGMLAQVPDYVPKDIGRLVDLADRPGALRWVLSVSGAGRVCGPTFGGSAHVGGADADFIAARHLIDCKATVHPHRQGRAELYQLAGYLLLDYDDLFRIDRISLYLARQGMMIGWTSEEFLHLLGARKPLAQLRAACRTALSEPEADPLRRTVPRQNSHQQDSLFPDL